MCFVAGLFNLTERSSRFIHTVASVRIFLPFRLNHILLHVQTVYCLCIHPPMVLGHLHFLAIVNNAAVNMHRHLCKSLLSVLSGIYPAVESLDQMVF